MSEFRNVVVFATRADALPICQMISQSVETSQVQMATTAKQAIDLIGARNSSVDLVLLDTDMPDLDCFELICHLKNREIDVPLLVLGRGCLFHHNNVRSLAAVYRVNVIGEIGKPVDRASIAAVFEQPVLSAASLRA